MSAKKLVFSFLFVLTTLHAQPVSESQGVDNTPDNKGGSYHESRSIQEITASLEAPLRALERSTILTPVPSHVGYNVHADEEVDDLPNLAFLKRLIRNPEQIGAVERTPIKGLFQITLGNDLFYLSRDGRYLIQGDILDLKNSTNLTEVNRNTRRAALLAEIPNNDLIIYPADGRMRYRVTIFSDVDCTYCRIVHDNIPRYNQRGIEVRYAAFPRNGLNSVSYQNLVSVWCAEDRKVALARASAGLEITTSGCDAPVKREYQIGLNLGVNGTPSFVLEDGTMIAGYVTPENLLRILQSKKAR